MKKIVRIWARVCYGLGIVNLVELIVKYYTENQTDYHNLTSGVFLLIVSSIILEEVE